MITQNEQSGITRAEKSNALESHIKALEKKVKEEEFDYGRICARKDAVCFKLWKYGMALGALLILLMVIGSIVTGTVDEVVRLKWSSSEDGLTVLFGLIAIVLLLIGCVWVGIRIFRLIQLRTELKEQEISVGAKLSFSKVKLEEYREELKELCAKQGEADGQD